MPRCRLLRRGLRALTTSARLRTSRVARPRPWRGLSACTDAAAAAAGAATLTTPTLTLGRPVTARAAAESRRPCPRVELQVPQVLRAHAELAHQLLRQARHPLLRSLRCPRSSHCDQLQAV